MLPFVALVGGLVLLGASSWVETQSRADEKWRNAVIAVESKPPWDNLVEIAFRRLPIDHSEVAFGPGWDEVMTKLGWDKNEAILLLSLPQEDWDALLASGRLPEPGEPEAVAGDLARWDKFTMDGTTFEVVGRARRGIPLFTFAYALPDHEDMRPFFAEERGGKKAWLVPDGLERLAKENISALEGVRFGLLSAGARTTPLVTFGTVAGLALVALGGVLVQLQLFQRLSAGPIRMFDPVLRDMAAHRGFLWAVHGACYGVWFPIMVVACRFPVANMHLQDMVQSLFSEGGLSYIGAAYASGNVLWAAATTFFHNYVFQTLTVAVLPSLFIPFWGLVKNLFSFALVGFAMAPIWLGTAGEYIYHSITMVIELEGYILAAFVATRLPIRCFKGFRTGSFGREYLSGLRVIASGALLVGVLLAVAAVYEATTIIALH